MKKEYVRDVTRRIIGSVTSGFTDESEIVRDGRNTITGRTSSRFNTTRDEHGSIVSPDNSDSGLVIPKK